ncbi:GEM-like protein 4 [Vitis vinifera]|uniref:GEM-like protein 4 n=1 Tax=Vitis vinifera TaxID=29760 RepID=A0A438JE60_VITVI|nr:GEM-like protein 4 [Vitis vinifera]
MKNQVAGQVIGIPISFPNENPSSSNPSLPLNHNEVDRMKNMMNQHGKKGDNIVHGIREHGKPIAGLLFLATQRVAFGSERSIKFSSPNSELVRIYYKVSIPLRKIKRVDQSENMKNPSQKYMGVVTADDFEFWFMGFLNYQKAFNCLQKALMSQS